MFRTIQKQWVAGLISVGLMVGSWGLTVNAQQMEINLKPSDFIIQEAVGGSIDALVGGFFGWLILKPVLKRYISLPSYCKGLATLSDERCVVLDNLAWAMGSSLGASLAVISVGVKSNVRGNILMTFIGASTGTGLAFWTNSFTSGLIVASMIPGILAMAGFNLGATINANVNFSTRNFELAKLQLQW